MMIYDVLIDHVIAVYLYNPTNSKTTMDLKLLKHRTDETDLIYS